DDAERLTARLRDVRHGALEPGGLDVAERQARALLREAQGDRAPESVGGARHDSDSILYTTHGIPLPSECAERRAGDYGDVLGLAQGAPGPFDARAPGSQSEARRRDRARSASCRSAGAFSRRRSP